MGQEFPLLDPYDHLRPVIDSFPLPAIEKLRDELQADGADAEASRRALTEIVRHAAGYLYDGPDTHEPEAKTKRELLAIAKASEAFERAMHDAGVTANVRLGLHLSPPLPGLFRSNYFNPDPILPPDPRATGGLLGVAATIPANLLAKHDRLRSDLAILSGEYRRAAAFRVKRGRPENTAVQMLFRTAILAWARAAKQWPPTSQVDGVATAPLLIGLRELIWRSTDDERLKTPLTDKAFLRALRSLKRRSHGLLGMHGEPGVSLRVRPKIRARR